MGKVKEDGTAEVGGHLNPLPRIADQITFEMQSGRIGVYKFTDVKPCGDPPDMFFADVKWLGYVDEISKIENSEVSFHASANYGGNDENTR